MPTIYKAPAPKIKTSMKALAYFAVNPDGVRFETQEEKEDVVLFLRQHPIVNVPWIIGAIVMLIAPTVLFPFIFSFLPIAGALPVGYMIVGTVFWYVAAFGFILGNFLYWFFNIYIVTNERVVDIDFLYLLYKRFSQAELTKIQDLSYASGGVLATVFDYGNVIIETAGEAPNLEFGKVPHPQKVVETIRSVAGLGTK